MSLIQAWNKVKLVKTEEKSIFAKKYQMLLGTKERHDKLSKSAWLDEKEFIKLAVSIPFRRDVRKPIKIILIGGSRIGKTTLVSCIIDDLQNDFGVHTLSIYPKGHDAVFHNKKGKGKHLCPGEANRILKNKLYSPFYKENDDTLISFSKQIEKFAFELYDFNPNEEPGFMEDNLKDYQKGGKGVYVTLSILCDMYPEIKGMNAKDMLEAIDRYTYQKKKQGEFVDYTDKLYVPHGTYEALRTRLMGAISKKVFFESAIKINQDLFIKDWNDDKSHAFKFFADPYDPRVQSHTAKILQIAQKAKRKDNLIRLRKGLRARPLWLILDDAREIVASWMDYERYRARVEVERCIYMYGEDGWNVLGVYHNAKDVPEGIMKEADFVICSKIGGADTNNLPPNEEFRSRVQRLRVKSYNYYNEWAVLSKDGKVRTFFAIDSRVGLR